MKLFYFGIAPDNTTPDWVIYRITHFFFFLKMKTVVFHEKIREIHEKQNEPGKIKHNHSEKDGKRRIKPKQDGHNIKGRTQEKTGRHSPEADKTVRY